eukprot:maker-scaffold_3-snap-gene-16.19-mRNA-1 protein AED:0.18 eAED:0.18 QI:32/0.42/0.25/0.62/0.85/0.75/8/0/192
MSTIRELYEKGRNKNELSLSWNDNEESTNKILKFRKEIQELTKMWKKKNSITSLSLKYAPMNVLHGELEYFLLNFPLLKELALDSCTLSEKNFKILCKVSTTQNLNYVNLSYCSLVRISSFCSFLKNTKIKHLRLCGNKIPKFCMKNILGNIAFSKTILKVEIEEENQADLMIVNVIKNFLKNNKSIRLIFL